MILFSKTKGDITVEIHKTTTYCVGVVKEYGNIINSTGQYPSAEKVRILLNAIIRNLNRDNPLRELSVISAKEIENYAKKAVKAKPRRKEILDEQENDTMPTPTDTGVQTVNIKTQRRKVTPRKPFTPYGLNGYLVDKNGKVRLMLDRKAAAKTITLEPEMFSMLADMVKATQQQGEAQ